MADKPVVNNIASPGHYDSTQLNARFNTIADEFENVLGRNGVDGSDNTMTGNIDMDDNRITNVPTTPLAANDAVNKTYTDANLGDNSLVNANAAAASASAAAISETNAELAETNAETAETAAELAETNAAASAATINTPSIVIGDAKKLIQVNAAGDGYDLSSDPIISSFANANLDTDGTLVADSDTVVASQKAVKTYVDALVPASQITGDGTLTKLRTASMALLDGISADAIGVVIGGSYNDTISLSPTNPLDKGETDDGVTFAADGTYLQWASDGSADEAISAQITQNDSAVAYLPVLTANSGNFRLHFRPAVSGSSGFVDISTILSGVETMTLDLVYLTRT